MPRVKKVKEIATEKPATPAISPAEAEKFFATGTDAHEIGSLSLEERLERLEKRLSPKKLAAIDVLLARYGLHVE